MAYWYEYLSSSFVHDSEHLNIGVAFLGFWTVRTVLNPISGQVFDEGHDESGLLHSARWHDGYWMVDGIREAWLRCFVWMENLEKFLNWLRAQ
ncbi:uncharacterized protein TNCV_4194761 [Trichonephila clavipes]|nr:uncharacterized protein TNCV_4194761 [Trichonephila clavipes]